MMPVTRANPKAKANTLIDGAVLTGRK